MSAEKLSKIDIPESLDSYKVTLFWGLGLKQVIIVFLATLLAGLGIFDLASHNLLTSFGVFMLSTLTLLALIEIRGRNFYRFVFFVFRYFKSKPRTLIYQHRNPTRDNFEEGLFEQKQKNKKTFMLIFLFLVLGFLALILIGTYIYYVVHK